MRNKEVKSLLLVWKFKTASLFQYESYNSYEMDLTSGEVLYRANNIGRLGRASCPEISEDFWQFLDSTKPLSADESIHTGKVISATVESYIMKLRHRILTLRKSMELCKGQIVNEVHYESTRFVSGLEQQKQKFDSDTLQLVLEYYGILSSEIVASRSKLMDEALAKEELRRQASVLRDIRLFACHATVESRGKIGFTMLTPGSQQFNRCVKAVMDNVNIERFHHIPGGNTIQDFKKKIKVLNVFKLQNSYLAGKLQAASERVLNGKIKGLFCCLTREQFYSFSVFGLHAQSLPKQTSTPQPVADLQALAGELFSTAWFHSEPPANFPMTREIEQAIHIAGTASRLSTKAYRNRKSKKNTSNGNVAAGMRFSRYSTISNLQTMNEADFDGGIFLALCRVLVTQQRTIHKEIEPSDIVDVLQHTDCDCLYSSTTEEYVLLQPKFVLPEFFMHVQFPSDTGIGARTTVTGVTVGALGHGGSMRGNSSSGQSNASAGAGARDAVAAALSPPAVPAMLSVTAASRHQAARAPVPARGETAAVFPLENLLLQNALRTAAAAETAGLPENASAAALMMMSNQDDLDDVDAAATVGATHNESSGGGSSSSSSINGDGSGSIGGQHNPRQALIQKQAIVESLHRSVQRFSATKDVLLREFVKNVSNKLQQQQQQQQQSHDNIGKRPVVEEVVEVVEGGGGGGGGGGQ